MRGRALVQDRPRFERPDRSFAAQVRHDIHQMRGGQDLHVLHKRGLLGIRDGQDEAAHAKLTREDRERQRAVDGPKARIEPKFTREQETTRRVVRKEAGGEHHSDCDGQIERRTAFAQVRRGEVHGYARARKYGLGVSKCAFNPITRLLDRRIGQTDDDECAESGRDVRFHVHGMRIQTEDRGGEYVGSHELPRCVFRGTCQEVTTNHSLLLTHPWLCRG